MEVVFRNRQLAKLCSSEKEMQRKLGTERRRALSRRLQQIEAADNLADLARVPQARPHELSGDRAGQLAVDVHGPYRLILEPSVDPPPRKPEGGLDWSAVISVTIVEIEDYH